MIQSNHAPSASHLRTFFLMISLAQTTAIQLTCPYLTIEPNNPSPPIRIKASNKTINLCFNTSDLFTNTEEMLTFSCTLYSGTQTEKSHSEEIPMQHNLITTTFDQPLIQCPMPPSTLPSVDVLIVSMSTSWFTTSFEHNIFRGIDNRLNGLLATKQFKLNLGSGSQLLTASGGWINMDSMSPISNPKINPWASRKFQKFSKQDWASRKFQHELYQYRRERQIDSDDRIRAADTEEYHLVRWNLESGLGFILDGSVSIITISCMLNSNFVNDNDAHVNNNKDSVERLIKEIYRVLKPGTGVIRIAERYKDNGVLRKLITDSLQNVFGNYRNVGPLTSYSGDKEVLHLNHPSCVKCMRRKIEEEISSSMSEDHVADIGPPDYHAENNYFKEDNLRFENSMFKQGCWICHLDIEPIEDDIEYQKCETNWFSGIGCEHKVGRIWYKPKMYAPWWGVESIKPKYMTQDVFKLNQDSKQAIDLGAWWPCLQNETNADCVLALSKKKNYVLT